MEQAASCIFRTAAIFGMHRYCPHQNILLRYQIIPSFCVLGIFVFSTAYFIVLDSCLLDFDNNDCKLKNLNVTITCFTLVYELVMCLQYALSFYCGSVQCEEKLEILSRMERLARVLNCTEKIIAVAKKTNTLFLTLVWPGTLVLIYMVLVGPFSYLEVYRNIKVWFGFFVIYIWELKYVYFTSVQGNLFDELNKQIQVQFLRLH
jgi:hypothetical protein